MEALEDVQARHQKELRDLQSKITQKKKQATKKTRQGVNDECEQLEKKLKEKQHQELTALTADAVSNHSDVNDAEVELEAYREYSVNGSVSPEDVDILATQLQDSALSTPPVASATPKKRNRQKERLARRAAEQEAAAVEAEKEAAKLPNWKRQERTAMLKTFAEKGLVEQEIQPDGHCMYSAVADQLVQAGVPFGADSELEKSEGQRYKAVRRAAARYIESHPDDFAAFLEEPLGKYVEKIRDTAEWGGHLELTALSRNYDIVICVIQDGRTDCFPPNDSVQDEKKKIWLAYYHHGYGLGEHYNSLRRAS